MAAWDVMVHGGAWLCMWRACSTADTNTWSELLRVPKSPHRPSLDSAKRRFVEPNSLTPSTQKNLESSENSQIRCVDARIDPSTLEMGWIAYTGWIAVALVGGLGRGDLIVVPWFVMTCAGSGALAGPILLWFGQ